jgi:hypothetical protein
MHPLTGQPGYHAEIDLARYDSEVARRIRKVLVAGSSIGAVKQASELPGEERYFIRSELFEYLSVVANTARESDSEYASRKRLIQIVGVALEPDRKANAESVLRHVEPINPRHGFMAKVELGAVAERERRLVQDVLNAGMTLHAVQRYERPRLAARFRRSGAATDSIFFIRTDLFKTLLLYRAGSSALLEQRGPEPQVATASSRRTPLQSSQPPALPRFVQSAATREDLSNQFWTALLGSIGLDIAGASRVQNVAVREQAQEAWQALNRLAQANSRLRAYLKDAFDAKRDAFEQRYNELRESLEGDAGKIEVLDQVGEDVDVVFKSLLLLPETGVIDELIESLEAASQDSDPRPAEEDLRALLRSVRDEIGRIDKSRAEAWRSVVRLIETGEADSESQTIRNLDTVNKRPF